MNVPFTTRLLLAAASVCTTPLWVPPVLASSLVTSPADASQTAQDKNPENTNPTAQSPKDARSLLAALATVEGLEASFTERKKLALLRAPLVSKGHIYFTRPGYMTRVVEHPKTSKVRIGPNSLEVVDHNGKQAFDFRGRPDIKTFVESFVHVVSGNYDALASIYQLSFSPASAPDSLWELRLSPLRPPLSELISRMEIHGHGYAVDSVRILESRGDSTQIELTNVNPHRVFTADEQAEIFGLTKAD